jgi:beta-fructofuranosidase
MNYRNIIILATGILLCACGGGEELDNTPTVDLTLNKKNVEDNLTTPYSTFWHPSNCAFGDAMPYYNETDKTFYVFFLTGQFSSMYKGGINLTKTKDFGSFSNFIPCITNNESTAARDYNIGTGTCIKAGDTYHFFYSGFNTTGAWGDYNSAVVKATSTDLIHWTRNTTLNIAAPSGIKHSEFRDPNVFWDDTRNKYVMFVGGQEENTAKPVFVRYQSDDLETWEQIETIRSTFSENPQQYEFQINKTTWVPECPDVFKMGNKWYLLFGSAYNNIDEYRTAYCVADSPDGPWKICNGHNSFDGAYFYVAKTAFDGTNRYAVGWASTSPKQPKEFAYGGAAVTHKLVQQPDGRLFPVIPDAVDAKFATPAACKDIKKDGAVSGENGNFTVSNGKVVFNRNASSFKIEMKIDASAVTKNFGIAFGAYDNQQNMSKIIFDLTNNALYNAPTLLMTRNGETISCTPLIVPANKIFNVKIVVERAVCVVYINGTTAFTNHISDMEQNPWAVFADEGTMKFENIKVYKQ